MTPAQQSAIEQMFLDRAHTQGLKPKSAKYRKAEIEFFCGAMAALQIVNGTQPHAGWFIQMLSGRSITGK